MWAREISILQLIRLVAQFGYYVCPNRIIKFYRVTGQLNSENIAATGITTFARRSMNPTTRNIVHHHNSVEKLEVELNLAHTAIDEKQTAKLLFSKDPYLWKTQPEQIHEISQRLGWLSLADDFDENVKRLNAFAATVIAEGYTKAVLLGMGGSSLCSEVARETFGSAPGYLQLFVLDNTDPSAILDIEGKINHDKTLFLVASKSGNTEETLSFFRYFYEQSKAKNIPNPGNDFVAITDSGTPLVKLAEEYKFKKTFTTPSDLGGRYSVLSDFGLLPMSLMGIDVSALLASAKLMKDRCESLPAAVNPGISLGVLLGICQKHGRDKITFVLSSSIKSFGYWVEQLLAESTGKEGRGLIPINGEELGVPEVYDNDRVFIHVYFALDNNKKDTEKVKALEHAGHPVVRIELASKNDLGGEYFRWEVAAAIAGTVMDINPFDQPNVEESKKNTSDLLNRWNAEGSFKQSVPILTASDISVYAGIKAEKLFVSNKESPGSFIKRFTISAKQGDYIAFLPYFLMTDHRAEILQKWRQQLRNELKVATTLLNGPRYLHSTGQLHKGGPDSGLYIILIGEEEQELSIPGEKFGFATLHQAQAQGDFCSLDNKARRVIRIHLGKDIDEGLDRLYQSINEIK